MLKITYEQIFHIYFQSICYIIQGLKVWLNCIATPFAYRAIGFPYLLRQPFSCLALFCKYYFKSIEVCHRFKSFNL